MEVLAVVITDVMSSLQFHVPDIRTAIQKGEMGHTHVTKTSLKLGVKRWLSIGMEIVRGESATQSSYQNLTRTLPPN